MPRFVRLYGALIATLLTVAGSAVFAALPQVRLGSRLRLSGGTLTGTLTSSVASGSNAIAFSTNGARHDLGDGTSDFLRSDGTNVETGGGLDVAGDLTLSQDLTASDTATTFIILAGAAAATTSGTIAAVTINPNNALDADDLMLEVNNNGGTTSLFSIDYEGDVFLAGDINSDVTTSTFDITSDTTAATMSSTVAAITLAPTATPNANDLIVEINDAAGTRLWQVDLEGDGIFTGDLAVAGNNFTGTGTSATFSIESDLAAATASSSVAAITLKTNVALDANDLVVEVNTTADASLFTVDLEGDVMAARSITSSSGAAVNAFVSASDAYYCFSGSACATRVYFNAAGNQLYFIVAGATIADMNGTSGTTTFNYPVTATGVITGNGGVTVPDGQYLQSTDNNAGAPLATDCDADAERGRFSIDTTNNLLYVCNGATRGWDSITLTN